MNVITVSREYGAGGAEVAQRLAQTLGFQLLDRELLHRTAMLENVPDAELERLDEKAVSLLDRFRFHPPHQRYMHDLSEVVRAAAARGNVVLVGRGSRQIVGDAPQALHLRLVAPRDWRVRRMAAKDGISQEQALARCLATDRTRERFGRCFFGAAVDQPEQYDLVVNTGRIPLEDVAASVAALVRHEVGVPSSGSFGPRVLTLSRQLGSGETTFASGLAARLGLEVFDRGFLERQAEQLGVPLAEVARLEVQATGLFQRLLPGSLPHRYFEVLCRLTSDLAQRGRTLLVGRGAGQFLRDWLGGFHVRLVASPRTRVRRVMEDRWVREEPARKMMARSDAQRQRFCERYFGTDWSSPLEYHLTVCGDRLGPKAADFVAFVAERCWGRAEGRM